MELRRRPLLHMTVSLSVAILVIFVRRQLCNIRRRPPLSMRSQSSSSTLRLQLRFLLLVWSTSTPPPELLILVSATTIRGHRLHGLHFAASFGSFLCLLRSPISLLSVPNEPKHPSSSSSKLFPPWRHRLKNDGAGCREVT
ncbi:hypothetical protein PIB30_086342 [Stylosanthes scabra]|uniref:Uncharacterized protein n=1 Tax=Stylosanthes scabra TaxID=79078 RepID=A0ABU6ZRW9_9FABA|nr:hypothetical protein [Stylosanthes scabra]